MSGYKSLTLAFHALLVLSFFVHASVAATGGNCSCSPNPTTTIVLYIQPVRYIGTNTNYTTYSVAGIQGTNFGNDRFATFNVFDDPVTIAASPTSTLIGRSRGFSAVADLNGPTRSITSTILFTGGQYANSSLNIKGISNPLLNVPVQRAIDGGTNFFKDAIGTATSRSLSIPGKPSEVCPALNMFVKNELYAYDMRNVACIGINAIERLPFCV